MTLRDDTRAAILALPFGLQLALVQYLQPPVHADVGTKTVLLLADLEIWAKMESGECLKDDVELVSSLRAALEVTDDN